MKRVIVLIADGFEEVEALTVVDYLRRVEDIRVDLISTQDTLVVTGAHQIKVIADNNLDNIKNDLNYDAVVIPGGMPGATNLRDNKQVIDLIIEMNNNKKLIAAICAGPIVLQEANILTDKNVTSYPGFEEEFINSNYINEPVVVDDNVITSRGPSYAEDFALKLIKLLINKQTYLKISDEILLNRSQESEGNEFSDMLSIISDNYLEQYNKPFKDNQLARYIRDSASQITSDLLKTLRKNDNYVVSSSPGKGRWSEIPWILIRNNKITNTAEKGIYLVYLFSSDMERVYLSLNQGITYIKSEMKITDIDALSKRIRDLIPNSMIQKNI